tara:strand:- start:113 stop:1210 length:1098 start_codon:yes stop_codon:yes gene_type:complete
MTQNFMGKDGFQWFVGVVEDRQDPQKLGRVRVRCLGYHTEIHEDLKTADLPWAHPMNPITSATVSGIGQTPLGPVEGTWVVGFFSDGADAQQPIIMGTLPGVPNELPTKDGSKGFQDRLNANYPKYKNEPDTNRLAVNDEENPHPTLTLRKADRDIAVGVANTDITTVVDDIVQADQSAFWDEPETTYAAKYPFNHVMETEGGHLREYDDTVGAKRIHERHSSGTGYEIFDDGTKITRVKKDNYNIVSADEYCHIQGTARETIDGGLRVKVNNNAQASNNYAIEVGSGANVTIEVQNGDINLISQLGDVNLKAGKNMNIDVAQALNIKVGGAITETSKSKTESAEGTHQMNATLQDINGNKIELN